METNEFWEVVDAIRAEAGGDMGRLCELLEARVAGLPAAEAVSFGQQFDQAMDRAYHWPLWGAAYIIQGGCSDDAFTDFRSSLIARGQAAYERALADVESLVNEDYDDETWFYEGAQYAVHDGVEKANGSAPDRHAPHPSEPSGQEWSEDDIDSRFPRLAAKFG